MNTKQINKAIPKAGIVAGAEVAPIIVTDDQSIEAVVTQEFDKTVAEEAFMNEHVIVVVAETADEESPPHIILSVNGINQPIGRGEPYRIRRKFLEVLARCKETKYKQSARDMQNVEAGNGLIGRTALSYPFTVVEDLNPRGKAWLAAVLAEPA